MHFHFDRITNRPKEIFDDKSKLLYSWEFSGNKNLLKFNHVNFFVGANNSGKSRFLRGLIKAENNFDCLSRDLLAFKEKLQNYINYYHNFFGSLHYSERNEINSYLNILNLDRKNIESLISEYNKNIENYDFFKKKHQEFIKKKNERILNSNEQKLSDYYDKIVDIIEEIEFLKFNKPNCKKYIPILRTIHENTNLTEGTFKETIKQNYDLVNDVYTGLELFKQVLKLKTSNNQDRKKVKKFEKFLSKHFFNFKEIEITSNTDTNELLFSIDDIEYPIYDLGDGIQSLIITLFPIFTANKNDWFFIEEPETNIHPGLQRIFIETILKDEYLLEKNLKFFFTTHSNHFLDIALRDINISIFQFQKNDDNKFNIKVNVKPDKDVLDILGVTTSSVFLANTSIWVEGPTDRKYLSKFLNLFFEYKEEYLKEDIDYSFFEYGGNLIEHYLFGDEKDFNQEIIREKINSFALSNKIYLLADNDNVDMRSAKGKRRKRLEKNAFENPNFFYQNTELREIENLLPKAIIKGFLHSLVKDWQDTELLEAIDFNKKDYDKIGLGEFYETLLIESEIPKKYHKAFKADSGTLKNDYKIKLADFVANSEYKYEDFIEDNEILKEIIEKLYDFIKK